MAHFHYFAIHKCHMFLVSSGKKFLKRISRSLDLVGNSDSMVIPLNSHFQILFHLHELRVGKSTPCGGDPNLCCLFCLYTSMAHNGLPKNTSWVHTVLLNLKIRSKT